MNNPIPPRCVEIQITLEDWRKLLDAEADSGYKLKAWDIGSQAVHDWLARNSPQTLSRPHTTGYQWKELFLPKGTLLRTVFGGKHHHCIVEDDGLRFNGQPTSPSRFANAVGGVRRNAWRVVWVLLPNTTEWKLADTLRTKRRTAQRSKSRPVAGQGNGVAPAPARRAGDELRRDARERSEAGVGQGRAQPVQRLAPGERRRAQQAGAHAAPDGQRRQHETSAAAHAKPSVPWYGTTAGHQPVSWRAPGTMLQRSTKNKRHPEVPFGWAGGPYT